MMTLFFIFFFAFCAIIFLGIFMWFLHHLRHGSLTGSTTHTIDEQSSDTSSIDS
jgi:hypothetical protein